MYVEKKLLKHLSERLPDIYKSTPVNDIKENAKNSFHFYLISCIHKIFKKWKSKTYNFF